MGGVPTVGMPPCGFLNHRIASGQFLVPFIVKRIALTRPVVRPISMEVYSKKERTVVHQL